jgi:hypothetical protein
MSPGTQAALIEVIRGFTYPLQPNARIVPWLGRDHFIPNSFQFIIHLSAYRPTLYSFDTEKVALNNLRTKKKTYLTTYQKTVTVINIYS